MTNLRVNFSNSKNSPVPGVSNFRACWNSFPREIYINNYSLYCSNSHRLRSFVGVSMQYRGSILAYFYLSKVLCFCVYCVLLFAPPGVHLRVDKGAQDPLRSYYFYIHFNVYLYNFLFARPPAYLLYTKDTLSRWCPCGGRRVPSTATASPPDEQGFV